MRMKRKDIVRKTITLLICACLASMVFVIPAFAAGGAYVSDTYIEIAEGDTVYISAGVENAAGSYSVSSLGCASATGSGWLDNESVSVGVYGASVGAGTVTIYFDTLATYDEESLDGTSLSVSVNVYEPEDGYTPDKGQDRPEDTAQEEVAAAESTDPLKTTLDGAEYTVLKDLTGVELPKGFTEADGTYNGEKVKILTFGKELTLYVLKKTDDGSVVFRIYNEQAKKFENPKTIVQNSITYYLLNLPADEKAPEGYTAQEVTVNGFSLKGYVADAKIQEEFCFIRALADGTAGYYSYDMKQGSIQRCMDLEEVSNQSRLLKEMEEEAERAVRAEKLLKTLLLTAAAVIVALIAVLVILAVHGKKNRGGRGPLGGGSRQDDPPQKSAAKPELRKLPVMKAEDIPEGVGDLGEYESEIEHLVDHNTGNTWENPGFPERGE